MTHSVLCLGQDFWGTLVVANSVGHTKSIQFLPVKLDTVSRHNFGKLLFGFCLILSLMSMVLAQEGVLLSLMSMVLAQEGV